MNNKCLRVVQLLDATHYLRASLFVMLLIPCRTLHVAGNFYVFPRKLPYIGRDKDVCAGMM